MRVPILTYHAVNISGNDYADNDTVAFAADLRVIDDLRLRIVPLHWVVDELLGTAQRDLSHCVALTCDDGSYFDYHDLDHPTHGRQRSLFNAMIDFRRDRGRDAQPYLHLTSFVIASPEAREHIDRICLVGRGWMRDDWWRPAQASGLIAIENHSWDHNHVAVPQTAQREQNKGNFHSIETREEADAEIRQASDFIDAQFAAPRTSLFAYPYGESNEYLREEYFPVYAAEHRMRAAFATCAEPLTGDSPRWNLPRYICGHHWRSPEAIEDLLRDAVA